MYVDAGSEVGVVVTLGLVGLSLGKQRWAVLWRLWALVYTVIIAYTLGIIAGIAALIYMVIDLLWQFLLNSEGLADDGRVGDWLDRFIMWYADLHSFIVVGGRDFAGRGKFPWLP